MLAANSSSARMFVTVAAANTLLARVETATRTSKPGFMSCSPLVFGYSLILSSTRVSRPPSRVNGSCGFATYWSRQHSAPMLGL